MDLLSRLRSMPPGSLVPAAWVCEALEAEGHLGHDEREPPASPELLPTWREKVWICPAETRLGVVELCDALGKTKSWVYRHTSEKSGYALLPHRKLDGELIFTAGELRTWIREQEEIVKAAPMESAPWERHLNIRVA